VLVRLLLCPSVSCPELLFCCDPEGSDGKEYPLWLRRLLHPFCKVLRDFLWPYVVALTRMTPLLLRLACSPLAPPFPTQTPCFLVPSEWSRDRATARGHRVYALNCFFWYNFHLSSRQELSPILTHLGFFGHIRKFVFPRSTADRNRGACPLFCEPPWGVFGPSFFSFPFLPFLASPLSTSGPFINQVCDGFLLFSSYSLWPTEIFNAWLISDFHSYGRYSPLFLNAPTLTYLPHRWLGRFWILMDASCILGVRPFLVVARGLPFLGRPYLVFHNPPLFPTRPPFYCVFMLRVKTAFFPWPLNVSLSSLDQVV